MIDGETRLVLRRGNLKDSTNKRLQAPSPLSRAAGMFSANTGGTILGPGLEASDLCFEQLMGDARLPGITRH